MAHDIPEINMDEIEAIQSMNIGTIFYDNDVYLTGCQVIGSHVTGSHVTGNKMADHGTTKA